VTTMLTSFLTIIGLLILFILDRLLLWYLELR